MSEKPDVNALNTKAAQLKEVIKTFEIVQAKIEAIVNDERLRNEYEERGNFEDSSTDLISKADQILNSIEISINVESNRTRNNSIPAQVNQLEQSSVTIPNSLHLIRQRGTFEARVTRFKVYFESLNDEISISVKKAKIDQMKEVLK